MRCPRVWHGHAALFGRSLGPPLKPSPGAQGGRARSVHLFWVALADPGGGVWAPTISEPTAL
eukprot:1338926-Pyramimonas_sp.AAC.1